MRVARVPLFAVISLVSSSCGSGNAADEAADTTAAATAGDTMSSSTMDPSGPDASDDADGPTSAASDDSDSEGGELDTGGAIAGLNVELELATPEQIAIHAIVEGDIAADARVTVRYRSAADTEWREGHPLLRIHPEWSNGEAPVAPVDAFAGTIFDLAPGTSYAVELTLAVPGEDDQSVAAEYATRALPPAAAAATVTASPSDDLQAIFAALAPGDVLELAAGTYAVDELYLDVAGTADAPIFVRGVSRADVILDDPSGHILQLQGASHIVIENLTMQGSGTDSGTDASSQGISFWDGAEQTAVTIRGLDIVGVDMGIVAWGNTSSLLVYDNVLQGNNEWTDPFLSSNLTWNDDGIRVPGQGNAVFENTLDGFGDSFAVTAGVHSSAVYFYRNRITMTGDDAFEGDYSTRNIGFYDNYITNSATFVSLDPLYSGPLYAFRNVAINSFRGPFKLNNTNTGFLFYNNTIVRTEGATGWGWVQFNNGELRNWSYRNNLLVYGGDTGSLLAIESGGCDPIDFTHNAWYPDGAIWWSGSGASYGSLGEAIAGAGQPATTPVFGDSTLRHEHDVLSEADPFASPVQLGADHLTLVTLTEAPALASGASPSGAGVAIPNVTDGYSGAAPDIGAIIAGRPTPQWGAQR
ncbi:MAG TPA: hypothetical protein VG755_25225 [Nannocystaceae bacterium]|nr:hypothetical protein [Nannocystaceae bacterium]